MIKTKRNNGKANIKTMGNLLQIMSADIVSRTQLLSRLGKSYGGQRDIYKDLGYAKVLEFDDYWDKYQRLSIAKPIVEAYPLASWASAPEITEDETKETPFEEAWKSLVKDQKIFHYLLRADILSGVGEYGVLLMGFDDGQKDLSIPVTKASRLLYLQAYNEINAVIQKTNTDPSSALYGMPETYRLTLSTSSGDIQGSTQTTNVVVHRSRVLHIAEGLLTNNVRGTPRLKCVYNELQNMELVVGSSGEMFWRGAFPGLAFMLDADAKLDPKQGAKALEEQITKYMLNFQRYLQVQGMDIKQLVPNVADPGICASTYLELIAGATRIPKRILIGSEEGVLAGSQDETAWNNRVNERRMNYCEAMILRPFIDRLIQYGVLPEPINEYEVKWPDVHELSEQDKAITNQAKANTLATYVNAPGVEAIVPVKLFLEKFMGFTEEEIANAEQELGGDFEEFEKTRSAQKAIPPKAEEELAQLSANKKRGK